MGRQRHSLRKAWRFVDDNTRDFSGIRRVRFSAAPHARRIPYSVCAKARCFLECDGKSARSPSHQRNCGVVLGLKGFAECMKATNHIAYSKPFLKLYAEVLHDARHPGVSDSGHGRILSLKRFREPHQRDVFWTASMESCRSCIIFS